MANQYLIQISIGPVQDFIASARKLRDLWFGSMILSELAKCVAKSLAENGCELIFPAVPSDQRALLERGSDLIVANKILVRYEGENPADLIAQAKSSWRDLLTTLGKETLENITSRFKKIEVNRERFGLQVEDMGEFYGVWVPLTTDGYLEARQKVESLLAGRKAVREFESPSWEGSGVPKNSLDGYRESVLPEGVPEIKGLLKKGEKLDAMGCIKRFCILDKRYDKEELTFADLSDTAITPWLRYVTQNGDKKLLTLYEESVKECQGGKFFSDDYYLTEQDFREFGRVNKEAAREAKNTFRGLCKKHGEPTKYTCVLLGDGDKMGEMISTIKNVAGHQRFSSLLSEFATEARKIVEEHKGSLIYAGGDDVLAYAPLHKALTCAKRLQEAFVAKMKVVVNELKLDCQVPTFSIGMAIVHHSEPLSNALNTARAAERHAKETGGRNALAVIQDKRSGDKRQIVGKWHFGDSHNNQSGVVERLEAIMQYYSGDKDRVSLSSSLGYQLRLAMIEGGDDLDFEVLGENELKPRNAQSAMVLKIIRQKEAHDRDKELEKAILLRANKISALSQELIVAYQFASVSSRGER